MLYPYLSYVKRVTGLVRLWCLRYNTAIDLRERTNNSKARPLLKPRRNFLLLLPLFDFLADVLVHPFGHART